MVKEIDEYKLEREKRAREESDKVWLPMLLAGKKFTGHGFYRDWNDLVFQDIHEVNLID